MTLAAELSKEPTTAPQATGRGRIVRPLGRDEDGEEEPRVSVDKKLEKDRRPLVERIREVVHGKRGMCMKSWEIALALRCEADKQFFDALDILKHEDKIKGVRGKGWRTLEPDGGATPPAPAAPSHAHLDTGTTLAVITKVQQLVRTEPWVRVASMSDRLKVSREEIMHAVAYLKSVGEIRVMRGGHNIQTTKVDRTVLDSVAPPAPPATNSDVLDRVRALFAHDHWMNVQSIATRLDLPFIEAKQAVDYLKALGELACGKGGKLTLLLRDETVQELTSAPEAAEGAQAPAPATKTPQNAVETAAARIPRFGEPSVGEAPRFGVDDAGRLAITAKGATLQLDPEDIARLEEFIRRTKPLWKGE